MINILNQLQVYLNNSQTGVIDDSSVVKLPLLRLVEFEGEPKLIVGSGVLENHIIELSQNNGFIVVSKSEINNGKFITNINGWTANNLITLLTSMVNMQISEDQWNTLTSLLAK